MPALRAGNAVVIKPSPFTPLSTLRLVQIMAAALPAGLVNSVVGEAEVRASHGRAPGHCQAGVHRLHAHGPGHHARRAAGNLKRLTLELGGNDAAIVLPGTDTAAIAEGLFATAFLNMGQTCAALLRLYVHEPGRCRVRAVAAIAARQVLGGGLEPASPSARCRTRRSSRGRGAGARRPCPGRAHRLRRPAAGPAWLLTRPPSSRASPTARPGGRGAVRPRAAVIAYRTVDEAVALANASSMGPRRLGLGRKVQAATALAPRLECGTVWVNSHAEVLPHRPFGGSKMSGVGVEFGLDGLLEYAQPQLLNING